MTAIIIFGLLWLVAVIYALVRAWPNMNERLFRFIAWCAIFGLGFGVASFVGVILLAIELLPK